MNYRKLPIGESDFANVITADNYYVDKSLLIKEIIADSAAVILLPRPRRFGKTLNMTMLRHFFGNRPAKHVQIDPIRLFDGLATA